MKLSKTIARYGFLMLLCLPFLSPLAGAQTANAGKEGLLDVVSLFNGAFPLADKRGDFAQDDLKLIGSVVNNGAEVQFYPKGPDKESSIVFVLAAPAVIESFAVHTHYWPGAPKRVELAVSQSSDKDFQTIARIELAKPDKTVREYRADAEKKLAGRFVRLRLLGISDDSCAYQSLRYFRAFGRFTETPPLRQDFGGTYFMNNYWGSDGSAADKAMSQAELSLKQSGTQVEGCYYDQSSSGGSGVKTLYGTISGGVEGGLLRFTRTDASGKTQHTGVMTLYPGKDGKRAHLAMLGDIPKGAEKDGYQLVNLARHEDKPVPCVVKGEKEKSASEKMQERLESDGRVQLFGVNFDHDSDVLRPESNVVLDAVVKLAKANAGWKFKIAGHTDSTGKPDYNQSLSERRAASVLRYLAKAGIAAERLSARGYGATKPLIANDAVSEAARAQNRRVELVKK